MNTFTRLLLGLSCAAVAGCAQMGSEADVDADEPRPEVRYYLVADT